MTLTAKKQKELTGHTCPNFQPDYSGYCEECYQRTDCMLRSVVHGLESMKAKSAK